MAVFGKALGNGYAITSLLGKKDIMKNHRNHLQVVLSGRKKLGTAGLQNIGDENVILENKCKNRNI